MQVRNAIHYLELPGAIDTGIEFSPKRWKRREVFGELSVDCEIDGVAFDLDDVSVMELGLRQRDSEDRTLLDSPGRRHSVRVIADGVEVFASTVESCGASGNALRFRFVDNAFDIESIASQGTPKRLSAAIDREELVQELVPARYAELVGRFAQRLRALRTTLDREEATVADEAHREEIVACAEASIFASFEQLWREANEMTRGLSRIDPRFAATKAFAEVLLCPELAAGPMWHRAYTKPLGYPGDFRVMEHAYARYSKSGTLYGDAVDRLISDRMGACVRERMVYARTATIEHLLAQTACASPLKVTSIGAGSARELDGLLEAPVPQPLEITLVEQDAEALQLVYDRVYKLARRRTPPAELKTLNASFVDLLRSGRLYSGFEEQDVIYSLGLIDYFNQPTARRVTAGFYEKLKPGGMLILCNMRDFEGSAFWPLEYLCDWRLEYRSRGDMLDLAEGLERADVTLEVEPTGLVWMLTIRKRT